MYWLLTVTWKRRKGKPSEVIGLTTGGALHMLFVSKALAERLKVPQSWVDFKLYKTRKEVKKLAPVLYQQLLEQERKEAA